MKIQDIKKDMIFRGFDGYIAEICKARSDCQEVITIIDGKSIVTGYKVDVVILNNAIDKVAKFLDTLIYNKHVDNFIEIQLIEEGIPI